MKETEGNGSFTGRHPKKAEYMAKVTQMQRQSNRSNVNQSINTYKNQLLLQMDHDRKFQYNSKQLFKNEVAIKQIKLC